MDQPTAVPLIVLDGEILGRNDKYKYIAIVLDNKLQVYSNVSNYYDKCHYRIYCLHRLRNTGIN